MCCRKDGRKLRPSAKPSVHSWRRAKSSFGHPIMRPTTNTGNGLARTDMHSKAPPSLF